MGIPRIAGALAVALAACIPDQGRLSVLDGSSSGAEAGRPDTSTADAAHPVEASADAGGDGRSICPNDNQITCPTPMPSYTTDIVPIINTHCSPCHLADGVGVEASGYNFSNYADIARSDPAILATQILSCAMPPPQPLPTYGVTAGQPPLSLAQQTVFTQWILCGMPDD